jgi:hypothetical protein
MSLDTVGLLIVGLRTQKRPQFDSHKHKNVAEGRIVGLKEITSLNPVGGITQQGGPGLFRYPMHPHAYLDPLDQAPVEISSRLP